VRKENRRHNSPTTSRSTETRITTAATMPSPIIVNTRKVAESTIWPALGRPESRYSFLNAPVWTAGSSNQNSTSCSTSPVAARTSSRSAGATASRLELVMAGFMIESRANPTIANSLTKPFGPWMRTGSPTSRPASTS
jgi:hypothetical protein